MRAAPALIVASFLVLCSGCKSNCRKLSELLCQCITTTIERDACLSNAANQEARYAPNAEQDEFCEQHLSSCNCFTINTPEGRIACGLAIE